MADGEATKVYEGFEGSAPTGTTIDEIAKADLNAPLPGVADSDTTHVNLVDTYNSDDQHKILNTNPKINGIINNSIVPMLRSKGFDAVTYMTDLSWFVDNGKAINSLTARDLRDVTDNFIIGAIKTRFINSGIKRFKSVFMVDELRLGELLQISYRKTTRQADLNNVYALQDGEQYDIETYHGFEVDTKVFGKPQTFRLVFSVPHQLYDTAFESGEDLSRLYTFIMNACDEDMAEKENGLLLTLYQAIITECADRTIYIDEEFNKKLGLTGAGRKTYDDIKADETLSRQFSAWLNELITAVGVGMNAKNSKYNDGTVDTSTPDDRRVIVLNTMFNSYLDNNKYSAYHEIGKPSVELVDYWQTSGQSLIPNLADVTGVAVNVEGTLTTVNGVVGFIADKNLGGVYVAPQKTTSAYNGNGDFTTYFTPCTNQRIFDSRANCVLLALKSIGGSYS